MADQYLTIAKIAQDANMYNRVTACAAQQHIGDPHIWARNNCFGWAASPGWAEAWDYSVAVHPEPEYEPGADAAVITDGMILSEVQLLKEQTIPAA